MNVFDELIVLIKESQLLNEAIDIAQGNLETLASELAEVTPEQKQSRKVLLTYN